MHLFASQNLTLHELVTGLLMRSGNDAAVAISEHLAGSEEAFPAFFTMLIMPLSYSIATGVGAGFILYAILKLSMGQGKTVHPLLYVFAVLFIIQIGFFA